MRARHSYLRILRTEGSPLLRCPLPKRYGMSAQGTKRGEVFGLPRREGLHGQVAPQELRQRLGCPGPRLMKTSRNQAVTHGLGVARGDVIPLQGQREARRRIPCPRRQPAVAETSIRSREPSTSAVSDGHSRSCGCCHEETHADGAQVAPRLQRSTAGVLTTPRLEWDFDRRRSQMLMRSRSGSIRAASGPCR